MNATYTKKHKNEPDPIFLSQREVVFIFQHEKISVQSPYEWRMKYYSIQF